MAAGIFFAGGLLFSDPERVHGNRWVGVLFSTVFIFIGGALVYAVIAGSRMLKEQAAAQQANPDSPWLWRKDWAAHRAESKKRDIAIGLGIAAVMVNGIAFTVAGFTVPQLWRTSNLMVLLPLIFTLVGIILAVAAIRASIRRKRFGRTYFEFASLPFSPGGSLKGTIHLRFNTEATHGVDLSLSCIRRVVTGGGEDRSTQETVLWQADKNVPQQLLAPGPMGEATIPVDFSIPSDAYETYEELADDKVLWLLQARADVPGVNYSDEFEVPVFRLTSAAGFASASASASAFEPAASFFKAQEGTAPPAFQSDASDVPAPAKTKVVVSAGRNGGTEFYFPAFRNPRQVLLLLVVTTIWTAVVYSLFRDPHAPGFFGPVFAFFDVFLIYGLLKAVTGTSRIQVGDGRIRFRSTMLGMGTAREVSFSEIAQILTVTIGQQRAARASYYLYLFTKDGRKLTLADAIDSRQEARWVAAQLEKLVGLKLDTHVSVQAGVGMSGTPPQRGLASSGSSSAFRRNSPVAIAVGFAIFLAWAGFVGYQILSRRHAQPKRVSKARAAPASTAARTPARTSLRPVAYSPLTNADVQYLQTLPEQAQAEELLARAIQHDVRALDLFEQKIGVWRNITRTARMNELEQRSCYSTDLRVRYANADLNLAIDGLPKTEQSAEQLIAMAQTDPEHRPYSVYHLGMLAGRGVGYDRIYPILVDYAKNDPNPQVRQWAVEGMRYLGTDEALDQLFDSFTHDPSSAVRDRAGCNVSDCGNFKRKQRMRMAPGLIELAADPQTTPQTRNWAFLALQEITDETLPADASVWRDWYSKKGAEKMAEFEQSDWWKVRGDQ